MSLKGHLGTIALPELLQWLAIGQKTGELVISRQDGVHRVAVDRGRIVSTSTSRPEMQLGRWLRDRGAVDEPTLERARRLREATGMSLGRVLLTLQAIREEELREALRDKAEALISSLFHSTSASFHFVEGGDAGDPGVALSLDATQLVLSAAHRLEQPPQAAAPADGETPAAPPPRPQPAPELARVVETLPETAAPVAERGRRRALGGLAAAAALVGGVTLVLVVGRSHVAAKAEATREAVVGSAAGLAAFVPAGAPAAPAAGPPSPPDPELAFPSSEQVPPPPAADPGPPLAAEVDAAAVAELLASREAAVRDELDSRYREELAELRRQLQAAQGSPGEPAAGPEAGGEPQALRGEPPIPETLPAAGTRSLLFAPPDSGSPEPAGRAPESGGGDASELRSAAAPDAADGLPAPTAIPAPTPARLLSRPAPVYPAAASRLRREAEVRVRLEVGPDGSILQAEVEGPRVGLGFDEAALAAARRSRWQPATEAGRPVASWATLRFRFELP